MCAALCEISFYNLTPIIYFRNVDFGKKYSFIILAYVSPCANRVSPWY